MITVINWRQSLVELSCMATIDVRGNFFYKSPEDGVLFSFILEIAEFDLGKTRLDSLTTKKLDLFVRFDTTLAVTRQTPARGI